MVASTAARKVATFLSLLQAARRRSEACASAWVNVHACVGRGLPGWGRTTGSSTGKLNTLRVEVGDEGFLLAAGMSWLGSGPFGAGGL